MGRANVVGVKAQAFLEGGREEEEVCPFIKLPLTFTLSAFIHLIIKPLKRL